MDRERAETHLRLLAEAELRRVMTMPAGSIPSRWYSARLALVAQALTAVGAVDADVAAEIQAHIRLAAAARHRLDARWPPARGGTRPALPRASWRVVPVGRAVRIQAGGVRRDVPFVAWVQSAGGARFIVTEWPFSTVTFTAADDRGVSYQVSWHGEMAPRELLLRPDPPHQIRWLDLTTATGQPATRIHLDPQNPAPVPDVTVTPAEHNPGELLLDVTAARILTTVAPFSQDSPGQPAGASADPRALIGDGPGQIVAALHAAGVLPPGSPVPGQLARLCTRLGIDGHGITAPPAADLPDRWHSMLTAPSREPQPPPAPGILAATAAELPDLDGAAIAIVGLHHKPAEVVPVPSHDRGIIQHHLERCTIMHLLAAGLAPEGDWPYATGLGPLLAPWIRDSDGRWHATRPDSIKSPWGHHGSNPWTDTRMVTAWLKIIPPLDRGTAWIEISLAGRSAQVRATLPLSPQ
jgi:hypothetical protein